MKALLALIAVAVLSHAAEKPNIIVVLCDDLGTGDLKCLNPQGKIATPRIDRFANEGMIFTDAHSGSGVCTPTRYGLITGRYCWRTPLQKHVLGGLSPRLIEKDRTTIAAFLKQQGYHTACVGKWHLGLDWEVKPGKNINTLGIESREQAFNVFFDKPFQNGPLSVGFDEYFGISASLDMVPYAFIEGDRIPVNPTEDRGHAMMSGKPGSVRKGPTSPGFEVEHVLPALTGRACKIIETQGKAGKPFFLYLPFASPHTAIAPTKEWLGKSGINPYCDFVMQQDHSFGQILDALEKSGAAKNTLVIFTSDNGCSPTAEFPVLLAAGHNPNHIYRGNKADIYEGGHRVPFIVRWPGHAKPGTKNNALICLNDIFRTSAEILGQKLPDDCAEDSISLLPALHGGTPARTTLVNHSINGSFALRDGDWKLCLCPGSGGWSKPRPGTDDTSTFPKWQLFNLKDDIAEKNNLIDSEKTRADKMLAMLQEIVKTGRSTPGAVGKNAVEVDIFAAGEAAMKPVQKKKKD